MMTEPEMKLFGRNISYPENGGDCSGECSAESSKGSDDRDRCSEDSGGEEFGGEENPEQRDEEKEAGKLLETNSEDVDQAPEESQNTNASLSESHDSWKSPPADDDAVSQDHPKNKKEQSGGVNSEHKTLKKPDKILPCPRCKSMDTKFCYYNNYNVNQPRHFCKSCQRYWTAGGTMRNMQVGAGKRKSKNSTSQFHHITLSEALLAARGDAPNGAVLSFGPDESMGLALNRVPNGLVSGKNGEEVDDTSLGSSVERPNPSTHGVENRFQQPGMHNMTGFPSPIPCIPWPFPWNSAVPFPAIFPPGYPLPYYTVPFWNMPWLPVPPPADQSTASSSPNSPLGKHSRSGELLNRNTPEAQKHKSSESSIVVPKTLRIDDPEEAAKSSIWSTLGIKYNSISKDGLFKPFQPKIDDKKPMATTSPLLQANPAALSRSLAFRGSA